MIWIVAVAIAWLIYRLEVLMALSKDVKDLLDRLDVATTAIAQRLQKLIDSIGSGMNADDVSTLKMALGAEADKLDAMGKDPAAL